MIDNRLGELRECFTVNFTEWLLKSNNPLCKNLEGIYQSLWIYTRLKIENESLKEILNILLKEPLADYFWYNGDLTYSLPHDEVVPSESLRVDKEKIKIFLRDTKIESILQ
jgi:hypothetical protein